MTTLDHIVLGCSDLVHGSAWLERFLGVVLSEVGVHAHMGTHNRMVALGHDRYLELIAINPDAPPPPMPRWFGLDTRDVQERIAQRPRLLGWVVRTSKIDYLSEETAGLLGGIHAMERGQFKWRITLPADGHPVEAGLVPTLIQWDVPVHPCQSLLEQNCRLEWMEAAHPQPDKIRGLLRVIGVEDALTLTATAPYTGMTMCAYLRTPDGMKTLMS
jgi:hypothetical protein